MAVLQSVRAAGRHLVSAMAFGALWRDMHVRTRFRIIDTFFNYVLFTPLIVLFQVGTNTLLDRVLYEHIPPGIATLIVLGIGVGIEFTATIWQRTLMRTFPPTNPDDPKFLVVTRLYMYAIGFANVAHYRGISDYFYALVGQDLMLTIQTVVTTIALLWGLRVTRNITGAPLGCGSDSAVQDWWSANTVFRTQPGFSMSALADHALSSLGVLSLTNLFWIALWAFFDLVIYPSNTTVSIVLSWVIGYTATTICLLAESRAAKISRDLEKRESSAARLLFEDAYLTISTAGVILIWRGHWMFFENLAFYFPVFYNGTDITCVYGNLVAFLLMCLCYTTNMMGSRGCDIDGSLVEGEGVQFSVEYFAEFFREQIEEEARKTDVTTREKTENERIAHARAVLNRKKGVDETKPQTLRNLVQKDANMKKVQ